MKSREELLKEHQSKIRFRDASLWRGQAYREVDPKDAYRFLKESGDLDKLREIGRKVQYDTN